MKKTKRQLVKAPDTTKDRDQLIENFKRDIDEMDDAKIQRVVKLVKTLKKAK